jgi:hypothetical protein
MLRARAKLALLAAAVCLGSCQVQPVSSSDQLRQATSLADLLLNMKLATQSGLILRDDFYREDNLKRVFGAKSIIYVVPPSSRNIVVDLSDIPRPAAVRQGRNALYSFYFFNTQVPCQRCGRGCRVAPHFRRQCTKGRSRCGRAIDWAWLDSSSASGDWPRPIREA